MAEKDLRRKDKDRWHRLVPIQGLNPEGINWLQQELADIINSELKGAISIHGSGAKPLVECAIVVHPLRNEIFTVLVTLTPVAFLDETELLINSPDSTQKQSIIITNSGRDISFELRLNDLDVPNRLVDSRRQFLAEKLAAALRATLL